MLVSIRQLREGHNDARFRIGGPELAALLTEVDDLYGAGPDGLEVALDLLRSRETVRARGWVRGEVSFRCARCLEPAWRELDLEVSWTFMPRGALEVEERGRSEEGLRLEEDDLDVSFVEQGEIDLVEVVRELLLLELEAAPVCGIDSCAGMAYDLAPSAAGKPVGEERIDPRWAALAAMKGRLGGGDAPDDR